MRIYAAVGALLGWFALALQLYLMLVQSPAPERLGTVITFFSFFTILTNILAASVFAAVAFHPKHGWGKWLCRPSVQAATAVYIAIVGMVYQLLLRQLWNPQGAQWVADVLLHSMVPVGYVAYWLMFAPRAGLSEPRRAREHLARGCRPCGQRRSGEYAFLFPARAIRRGQRLTARA